MTLLTPQPAPFTWKIENFSRLKTKKNYSEIFHVGGYKWRLLIFPKGNRVNYLSLYLDVADSEMLPEGWSKYVNFSLSVINPSCRNQTVTKHTEHWFNGQESDWGFAYFLPFSRLYDPARGYLVNDTIVIKADVSILESQDSEEEGGFVGLANRGGNIFDFNNDSPAGKIRFLSYWVSSEASLLLERIHGLHKDTFTKFSMISRFLQTGLLESFALLVKPLLTTKISEANEEALCGAANAVKDFELVGLDLTWLKQRLDEAMKVNKHSKKFLSLESYKGDIEVTRTKLRKLEDGFAKATVEVEVMSQELPKSLGAEDFVLKGFV